MEIRRSKPYDATAIGEMEKRIFGDPWSQKDIFSYICSDTGMCFTALDCGEPIAYILGQTRPPEAEIYRIAVREDKRQRGIGYRLLSYALKTELGSGVETVFLEVRESNLPARALYKAYGFKEITIRKNYYQNPTENAVIMIKDSKII